VNNRPIMAYKLHNPTGMANHMMSLEIGLGLQYVYGYRQAIFYHCTPSNPHPWNQAHISPLIDNNAEVPSILDLVELPSFAYENTYLTLPGVFPAHYDLDIVDTWKFTRYIQMYRQAPLNYYVDVAEGNESDAADFADGRAKLVVDPTKDIDFKSSNLSYYSRTFRNRTPEFDTMMSQIRWRREYVELADRIAAYIGPFNGVHLRLTDHTHNYLTTSTAYINGLVSLDDYSKRTLVMCTDEPQNEMLRSFRSYDNLLGEEARATGRKNLLLADIITKEFANDYKSLPSQEATAFGLVCMLVMFHSLDFIGTPGSTYTGLIHRAINQRGPCGFKLFAQDFAPAPGGPYSWQNHRLPHKGVEVNAWWREWPESRLQIVV